MQVKRKLEIKKGITKIKRRRENGTVGVYDTGHLDQMDDGVSDFNQR